MAKTMVVSNSAQSGDPENMAVYAVVLPDHVAKRYQIRNPEQPQVALVATLTKFASIDPSEDLLVVGGEELKSLRATLGPISDAEDLATKAARGKAVALKGASSGVYVPLTDTQKKKVKEEADRLHVTEVQALQGILKEAIMASLGPY